MSAAFTWIIVFEARFTLLLFHITSSVSIRNLDVVLTSLLYAAIFFSSTLAMAGPSTLWAKFRAYTQSIAMAVVKCA
jgi:hypothetical protein